MASFRSAEFEAAVERVGARHLFIRAGRPQTNCVTGGAGDRVVSRSPKSVFGFASPVIVSSCRDPKTCPIPVSVSVPSPVAVPAVRSTMTALREKKKSTRSVVPPPPFTVSLPSPGKKKFLPGVTGQGVVEAGTLEVLDSRQRVGTLTARRRAGREIGLDT